MSNHCCQGKICPEFNLNELVYCTTKRQQHHAETWIRPWILTLCPAGVLCSQTQIYEAEYETEHNDHKHTLQENRRLRKKREEMRQQVALLQEQVVFELFELSSCMIKAAKTECVIKCESEKVWHKMKYIFGDSAKKNWIKPVLESTAFQRFTKYIYMCVIQTVFLHQGVLPWKEICRRNWIEFVFCLFLRLPLISPQLRVYEDDFRRERSDKQMLQRLLLKKTPPNKSPVLLHRCNNEQQPLDGDKRTQSGEKRKLRNPLCSKHRNSDAVSNWGSVGRNKQTNKANDLNKLTKK